MKQTITLALLCSTATAAHAAEPATDTTTPIADIVVTAAAQKNIVKSDVPLSQVPQNIQILSSQLIREQGANLLENVLQNVAGVMTGSYARSYDFYRIRGFDASGYTYVDGLPRGVAINAELAGLEQVEVIKGPSSVLFGQGSPGGLVNLISKRPQSTPHIEVNASYGSYDSYTGMIDITGPLTGGGALDGRIVANYRNDRSFIDFHPATRRLYVAPSLTWHIGPDTSLTILASLSKDWSELIPDQPAAGLVYAGPLGYYRRSLYIGDPDNKGKILQTFVSAGYAFRHRFNEHLSFYQNARYSYLDLKYLNLYQPLAYDPASGIQYEYGDDFFEKRNIYSLDSGFQLDATTGPFRHRVVLGVEYEGLRNPTRIGLGFAPTIAFNLYDPDYSVFETQPRTFYDGNTKSDAFGFYVQDTITLAPGLNLTAGGRYDTVKINDARYTKFSPRAGLTYELGGGFSAYLSYARSFLPQPGYFDLSGKPVPPETGEAYEAGVKLGSPDGRLNGTLAIYQITRSNVATAIPSMPSVYEVTGAQRSRGVELDGQFKLTRQFQLVASYAYTHAVVKSDPTIPVGQTVIGAPRHKASLWARYSIDAGQMGVLSASLGGIALSKQQGSLPNSYTIPSYALVNANIGLKKGPFSVQFNINNLFDKKYISGATGDLFVVSGEPRIWKLTLGWGF
ncbi:TonB-dependent siderophore receptor [Flavisphingomonas formosensis]|uniref:TonB-dependent siderophore receptor n=1 Tax=Flavisphingomonas formosensis TaxID=861534 RepID=UPI0012F7840E|nr:TonB-dependent receptor [Sphingomonas formosensis]